MSEPAAFSWIGLIKWIGSALGTVSIPVAIGLYLQRMGLVLQARQQATAERSQDVQLALSLAKAFQEEISRLRSQLSRYDDEVDLIRQARWSVDEVLFDLHSAAIAARVMVHDLERQAGLPETQFLPLHQPVQERWQPPPNL